MKFLEKQQKIVVVSRATRLSNLVAQDFWLPWAPRQSIFQDMENHIHGFPFNSNTSLGAVTNTYCSGPYEGGGGTPHFIHFLNTVIGKRSVQKEHFFLEK